jgi:hypothetical protein
MEEIKKEVTYFEKDEAVITVKQSELDRLYEICEILADNFKEIKNKNVALKDENIILKEKLRPIDLDFKKYEGLNLDDIDLSKVA